MPLAHFSNVRSHYELFEPIYTNLFEINFILPAILQAENRDPVLMMENATSVSLPLTPDLTTASQKFKFSDREFVLTPEKTSIEVEIKFNLNQDTKNAVFIWNTLKRWYDLAWNSQTGETFYKRDLVGTIIVLHHDKKGIVNRRVTYNNCQLLGVEGFDLDWGTTGIVEPRNAKWISDFWEDVYIDNV